MQVEYSVADLLTVGGVGAVTLILMQLVLKPLLEGLESPEKWRGLIINGTALVLAIALAMVAAAVWMGLNHYGVLQAFLTGLGGAVVATSGYEVAKNAVRLFH